MSGEPRKRIAIESASELLAEEPAAQSAKRPGALTGGILLVLARSLGVVIWILGFLVEWPKLRAEFDLDHESSVWVLGIVIGAVALWALVLLLFGVGLWRGSNTARMLTQFWAALSITAAAITYFSTGDTIALRATLLTLSLDILILLALSSRDARAWTRGKSRRWIAHDRAAQADAVG
ncbi:hypothetical protein [Leucobacter luti]|uniref:Uncharacterized protein n=1 Tax=Leucobacter luti TaxID=340320 RepID=A0A4Q7U126_9MICO|nr:hypothetical protein [Leucobacter luti]MBL3699443.1 hypothetical protein [Leucobacter luti]RZT66953.1 hypothetical protein EV139_1080 [Leucobacter luti]